jgi:hypothetical protein
MKNYLYTFLGIIIVYFFSYFFWGKKNMAIDILRTEEIEYLEKRDSINVHLFMDSIDKKDNNKIINLFKDKGFITVNVYHNEFIQDKKKLSYLINLNIDKKITPFVMFTTRSIRKVPNFINDWECIYVWFFYKWVRVYKHDILFL